MEDFERIKLEERVRQLESENLELKYRAGILERPLERVPLKKYCEGLYSKETAGRLQKKRVIIEEAKLADFGVRRESLIIIPIVPVFYTALEDSDGRRHTFRVQYSTGLRRQPAKEKFLEEQVKSADNFIVKANPKRGTSSFWHALSRSSFISFLGLSYAFHCMDANSLFYYFLEGAVKDGEEIYFENELRKMD